MALTLAHFSGRRAQSDLRSERDAERKAIYFAKGDKKSNKKP